MLAPHVSVVTPFYNTADWLGECIEAVLAQTFCDFEYLLVNNCSTDGSAEIARKYAAIDNRIRIIDQAQFLSQGRNFNSALRAIHPESRWCKLALADDLLLPNCLAEMVRVARVHPGIGLIASYYLAGTRVYGEGLPFPREHFSGREIARIQLLQGKFFLGAPNVVMYRADLVRQNPEFYPDHRYSPDTNRAYQILCEADFGFVHQVLSFLRDREGSIGSSIGSYKPYLLDLYLQLRTYGPRVLTPEEYTMVSRRVEREYFGFLGLQTLYRRDPGIWQFTQGGLATVGESFSGLRRLRWTLSGLGYVLTHPGAAIRFLGRRLSGGGA